MPATKTVALVAHDHMKDDLLEWADYHRAALVKHEIVATGTTGRLVADRLGINVRRLKSGPLGGDPQLGSLIAPHPFGFLKRALPAARASSALEHRGLPGGC